MLNPNDDPYAENRFDQLSHLALANHNVNVMLDTFERANYIACIEYVQLPEELKYLVHSIRETLS
ncbi:MAG: hypothetical protein EBU08_21125, partial [Micrococcales bacterium]|nr:hypothetical protein [Micrococcales bacterium]